MNNELVSVVIPAYNREKTIVRAIDSVLNQTYNNIECIIVDDCSKDGTSTLIQSKYNNDNRVIYYKLDKNSGACVARNKGVEISKGTYVAFLDSDDQFMPEKIEKQVDSICKSGADMSATAFVGINTDGTRTIVEPYVGSKQEILNQLLFLNRLTTGVLLGKRSCFVETPFDNSQPRYQDWDLAIRLFKKYNFVFINYVGLELIRQDVSISSTTSHEKTLKGLHNIYEKNKADYDANKKALSQIHWLMGLHSLFVPGNKDIRSLWKGVVGNGLSLHRLGVFVAVNIGLKKLFVNTIQNI